MLDFEKNASVTTRHRPEHQTRGAQTSLSNEGPNSSYLGGNQ